jgi:hypothetical protein
MFLDFAAAQDEQKKAAALLMAKAGYVKKPKLSIK